MILPTMTPKEKYRQIAKVVPYMRAIADKAVPLYYPKLRRSTRFPAFIFLPSEDVEGMGKWTVILEAESKGSIRKGIVCVRAFQTFHVSRAKNPENIGAGIYVLSADDHGDVGFHEYPPHYFHRLRTRLIEPRGIAQPSFLGLVKELLRLHHNSMDIVLQGYSIRKDGDGMYSMVRNTSVDYKDGYDNLVTCHKDGLSLGIAVGGKEYWNFTTFVPNAMLKDGQAAIQEKMMAEMRRIEQQRRLDPLATFDRHKLFFNK